MTATRKIIVVNEAEMLQDELFRAMKFASASKVEAMKAAIKTVATEREAFEALRERRLADGSFVVQQSNDIKHVLNLCNNDAVARLFVALKVNPREYLHPASLDGGKTSTMTSNLKAYKKTLEVAETIWSGVSTLENVVKVFTVCAFRVAEQRSDVIERDFAECFLSSVEYRTISQGSEDLWNAVDEVRAKHMSTGAQTQTSQMIRTLVALKSAEDVRDGRAKNVRVFSHGRVMQALMRRFGQVTDPSPETVAADA